MSDGITDMMREMNCTKCVYFQSYRDMYDGDDMEPTDCGRCQCEGNPLYGEGVTDEDTCQYFEPREES